MFAAALGFNDFLQLQPQKRMSFICVISVLCIFIFRTTYFAIELPISYICSHRNVSVVFLIFVSLSKTHFLAGHPCYPYIFVCVTFLLF